MRIRICLTVLALCLVGCAGQDVKEQSKVAAGAAKILGLKAAQ